MIRLKDINIPLDKDNKEYITKKIEHLLKHKINNYKIVKKSIDARKEIMYVYSLDIDVDNEDKYLNYKNVIKTPDESYHFNISGNKLMQDNPIVIGAGPAGMFLAYMLAKYHYHPIIIEQGEKIEDRVVTVNKFWDTNVLNIQSNVQFGEGGAGTFSDGKLNTLVKDKEYRFKEILTIFEECGAPYEITYINKPHIGTDILRKVMINLRNKIIAYGGVFRFNTKLTDINIKNNKVESIIVNNQEEIKCQNLFLCIGHSARDTFLMLNKKNINMEAKPFAVGIRIMHKQININKDLYHSNYQKLGAASYKLTYNSGHRGIYSFCMCPGGYVVNASSEQEKLAINGMSDYKRDSLYANSAIVVTVSPSDYGKDLFSGIRFQEDLEQKAYKIGQGFIPIQRYQDFVLNKISTDIPNNLAIKGKYHASNLNDLLPLYISDAIKEAISHFAKQIPCFDQGDVYLLGVESRTSSPIRILRNDLGMSNIEGIYPVGEGAGYAGGIMTSAADGIKQAENLAKIYKPNNY